MFASKLVRVAAISAVLASAAALMPAQAQTIEMVMSPPAVETNRYWNTPGDFALGPSMQGLVGHDPVTGAYDNSGLAESWSHNDDFTEWTFKLKPEAEFHFGWGPVTAADVVHSLALHTGPDTTLNGISQLEGAVAEAIDEHTVKFTLPAPQVDFLFVHGGRGSLVIYSKAQFDKEGLEGYDAKPAGTANLQYVERNIGQGLTFEKVEGHWSGQDAQFDRLELKFVAEPATTLAQLLSKEADIVILPRELQGDALDAGFEAIPSTNASNQTTMLFNGTFLLPGYDGLDKTLPWLDIRIREAINRSIDRQAVIDVLYDGRAEILPVFGMDPRHEGYVPELAERFEAAYGYDLEKARALMAEAGYPENFSNPVIPILSSTLAGNPEFPAMAELMQVFLDEAGFQTEIVEMDWASLGGLRSAREAKMFHPMRNLPVKPSAVGIRNYYSATGGPRNNYEDEVIEGLMEKYMVSIDLEERNELAGGIFTRVFEQYAVAPLASISAEVIVNPETVREWTFPGTTSVGVSHFGSIVPAN
ncbi:peptide ABC transporter [Roseobacter cerasinus]|uniref:Peptide ABC transporter n=1 Tax=Roseobacter cerasinus TaxID=2602289 RepID=A0A640VN76_9RHOB|nr:ABC transporter substrate-binding protein [Roseobacter cerasinus]GFE49703.1 peptide ABC transporter [Roseobacter cerasinus]